MSKDAASSSNRTPASKRRLFLPPGHEWKSCRPSMRKKSSNSLLPTRALITMGVERKYDPFYFHSFSFDWPTRHLNPCAHDGAWDCDCVYVCSSRSQTTPSVARSHGRTCQLGGGWRHYRSEAMVCAS